MAYQLDYRYYSSVFAVPQSIVTEHLNLCSPAALRLILAVLQDPGLLSDSSALARRLRLSGADLEDALSYWVRAGLIMEAAPGPLPALPAREEAPAALPAAPLQKEAPPAPAPAADIREKAGAEGQRIVTVSSARPRMTPKEIAAMAGRDPNIGFLIHEAQQKLGKPLSRMETEGLVSLYTYGGVPVDYILLALVYCVGKKKDGHPVPGKADLRLAGPGSGHLRGG